MNETPHDSTSSGQEHSPRAEPQQSRIVVDAAGRMILGQSARTIAQSRELELRVRRIAEQFRSVEERAVEQVDSALETLGASVGIAVRRTLDGAAVELVGAAHLAEDLSAELQRLPLDAPLPMAEVVRTGEPVYSTSQDELVTRYPAMRELVERHGIHALAAVPIRYLGALQGGVTFGYASPRTFSASDQSALRALGARYAHALRDSRLYLAERDAREAEQAARHTAEQARTVAEAAARAHGDVVAIVSHELRTPLQAILGYAELLADDEFDEAIDTRREFARRIALGSLSLLQIVENLLGFAAAQRGRQRLDIATFDLYPLITQIVQLAEPLALRKGIVLRAHVASLKVKSDARRIRQIVTNLLANAIKFTERGEVVVRVDGDAAADATHIRIVVRDTGRGIDAADVQHLFEPFWQGTRPALTSMHGTGLGLSIVRQLTGLLGGEVRVESVLGEGSTFTVELPRVAPAPESPTG